MAHSISIGKASTATAANSMLLKSSSSDTPFSWSADGRHILFTRSDRGSVNTDIWVLDVSPDKKALKDWPLLRSGFSESNPQPSPDGKWFAYTSNESGATEVYVRSFPSAGGVNRISTKGGLSPLRRADGKELFYSPPTGELMAVPMKLGSAIEAGLLLALASPETRFAGVPFAELSNGQRFILSTIERSNESVPVTIRLNWFPVAR